MKSIQIIVLFLSGIMFMAVARGDEPVDPQTKQKGYAPYPVVQCPKTSSEIRDLLQRVQTLKSAIKKNASCDAAAKKVSDLVDGTNSNPSLSSLVGDQRQQFLDLVKKGQSEGLNATEQKQVEDYVSQVSKTTEALLLVVTGNDACFEEDKKLTSLSFITTLIGEGAKILSLMGGPAIAGTVNIASNVITGFLKGMQEMKNNRLGYRFDDYTQRESYSENLCSLFDYRREVQNFLFPQNALPNLVNLSTTLEKQLQILKNQCSECSDLIAKINQQSVGRSRNEVWTKSFEDEVKTLAEAINAKYTQRLGTHTYRSLKTQAWIKERIQAISTSKIRADLGLQEVSNQLMSIESFLVDNQTYGFLSYELEQTQKNFEQLRSTIGGRLRLSLVDAGLKPPTVPYNYSSIWSPSPSDGLFEVKSSQAYLDYLNSVFSDLNRSAKAKILTTVQDIDTNLSATSISIGVVDRYCDFFMLARWYKKNIASFCEQNNFDLTKKYVDQLVNNRLLLTYVPISADFEDPDAIVDDSATPPLAKTSVNDGNLPVVKKSSRFRETVTDTKPVTVKAYTEDWVESLQKTVSDWNKDPRYTQRKSGAFVLP